VVQNPNPWAGKPVGETWPRRRTQDCSETTAVTGQRGTSSHVGRLDYQPLLRRPGQKRAAEIEPTGHAAFSVN